MTELEHWYRMIGQVVTVILVVLFLLGMLLIVWGSWQRQQLGWRARLEESRCTRCRMPGKFDRPFPDRSDRLCTKCAIAAVEVRALYRTRAS